MEFYFMKALNARLRRQRRCIILQRIGENVWRANGEQILQRLFSLQKSTKIPRRNAILSLQFDWRDECAQMPRKVLPWSQRCHRIEPRGKNMPHSLCDSQMIRVKRGKEIASSRRNELASFECNRIEGASISHCLSLP